MAAAMKKSRFACWTTLVLLWLASANTLAATFVVEQATDAALRAAVTQANQTSGPDRIEFADGVTSIAITEGQIEIFESLEIAGSPGSPVTLSGSGTSRILAVIDNELFPVVDLAHLIIEGGATTAPGTDVINDLGNPDCSVNTGNGGAICSETSLRLNDVIVRDSQTSGDAADGGGIWAASNIELIFSSVLNNQVLADATYGAGLRSAFGAVFCDYSRIAGNVSLQPESRGGGVFAREFVGMNCVVSNNQAAAGAGVVAPFIDLAASTVSGNTAEFRGGGILGARITISDGEPSQSSLVIVNSTISGNQAGSGGGGGISAFAGDQANFRILNSTITDNAAPSVGGVEIVDPFVGFQVLAGSVQSDRSPGLGVEQGRIGALAKFDRTKGVPDTVFEPEIVSTLISGNQNDGLLNPDLELTPSSDRETNLIQQGSFVGPEFFDELALAPLADNGCFETAGADADPGLGCAQTHRLRAGSTAIDQGLNIFELEFDQRGSGFPRVNGVAIDIGSYEFEALQLEVFSLSASVLRQGDPLLVSWSVVPDQDTVSCLGTGLPGTSWDGLAVGPNGELSLDTVELLPGNYTARLECQRDGEIVFAEAPLEVLVPIEVSLDLVPETVRLGEPATISWAALPDDSATVCSAESVPQIPAWSGPLANSGSIEIDSGQLLPGTYQLSLECARNDFSAAAQVELIVTDDPLELSLDLVASPAIVGDAVEIEWLVTPGDEFSSCSGFGLDGTDWNGPRQTSGLFVVDTALLGVGSFVVGLECSRPGQTESVTVPLEINPLALSLSVNPSALIRGDELTISWVGTEGVVCTGSGLPGTNWNGAGKPASGQQVVNTLPLPAGDYQVGLLCERNGVQIERQAEVTVLPLELALSVNPGLVIRGDDLTISWTGTEGAVCTGSGLPGTDWNGAGKPASGQQVVNTAPLPAGDYQVGLLCERNGVQIDRQAAVTVQPPELVLTVDPAALIRGDDLTISWTASEGAVCTGSGLPGTNWNGAGKPASGQQVVNTAPLPAGDYPVGLLCERNGVQIERQAEVTVLPLELALSVNPGLVIRGDDLTISWTATEGAVCTGTGLPGTDWSGGGKPASGQQVVNTAPLPAGDYPVGLLCERNGVQIERQVDVTVLPLELELTVNPTTLIRGDELTVNWAGTSGLVCAGAGLPGTGWDGADKPASGQQIVNTAPLPAGDYQVGLLCERNGLTIERQVDVTVLPLELELTVNPTTLIRGDELTVNWAGTSGLVCAGSGLPGTGWDGADKPASGTQVVNTEVLEPADYFVALTCTRLGISIERTAEVTVLAPPADLALAAVIVDMGIPGSDFVEFSTANPSENPAFDVQFAIAAPAGYEIADVFRSASQCAIDEESSEVRCDIESIGDWQCATSAATSTCTLAELPAGASSGLVVEFRGQGQQTVSGAVGASNADSRVAEIEIGTGVSP